MKINLKMDNVQEMLKKRGLEKAGTVQKYIDSEVLRRGDPYVPFDTGYLKKSGILGTKIGSGEVDYIAPYADINYYNNAGRGTQGIQRGGMRGKLWFERMKADHLTDLISKVKEKVGGK